MEDMHEMSQVICLHKSATKHIKTGKTLQNRNVYTASAKFLQAHTVNQEIEQM